MWRTVEPPANRCSHLLTTHTWSDILLYEEKDVIVYRKINSLFTQMVISRRKQLNRIARSRSISTNLAVNKKHKTNVSIIIRSRHITNCDKRTRFLRRGNNTKYNVKCPVQKHNAVNLLRVYNQVYSDVFVSETRKTRNANEPSGTWCLGLSTQSPGCTWDAPSRCGDITGKHFEIA